MGRFFAQGKSINVIDKGVLIYSWKATIWEKSDSTQKQSADFY